MSLVEILNREEQNFKCTSTIGNHNVSFDVDADKGGQDLAPSPHEMLLASLGACTAITLRMYAQRKGWPLEGVTVSVEHEDHSKELPIHKTITLHGPLDAEQTGRLYSVAEKCPVNQLLKHPVEVQSMSVAEAGAH